MQPLRRLLAHPDAGVRARVCNLIGNMCRHSGEALRDWGCCPRCGRALAHG